MHNIAGVDTIIIIRDQAEISTHFTNEKTAALIRPKLADLFNCDLVIKKEDKASTCDIVGKNHKDKTMENNRGLG